jgi:RNA polymerase sigma factor (sigma-70 family)
VNPPNRTDLRLNRKQQKLFDDHLWLIWRVVKRYGASCPENYFDDMLQHCRVALAYTAATWKPNGHEFGAKAWLRCRDAAREFLRGRKKFGSAAMRNAANLELSLDDVVATENGEEVTRLSRVEVKQADQDYQEGCALRNQEAALVEIAEALKELSPQERCVIQLRFSKGLSRPHIAKRLRLSVPTVNRIQRSAVRQLRRALSARGYPALPETAAIPQ